MTQIDSIFRVNSIDSEYRVNLTQIDSIFRVNSIDSQYRVNLTQCRPPPTVKGLVAQFLAEGDHGVIDYQYQVNLTKYSPITRNPGSNFSSASDSTF